MKIYAHDYGIASLRVPVGHRLSSQKTTLSDFAGERLLGHLIMMYPVAMHGLLKYAQVRF